MADTPAPMTDAEIARITILATDFDDGDFTGKPILSLIARVELERARVVELEAALRTFIAAHEFAGAESWDCTGETRQRFEHAASAARLVLTALSAGLNPGPDAL